MVEGGAQQFRICQGVVNIALAYPAHPPVSLAYLVSVDQFRFRVGDDGSAPLRPLPIPETLLIGAVRLTLTAPVVRGVVVSAAEALG